MFRNESRKLTMSNKVGLYAADSDILSINQVINNFPATFPGANCCCGHLNKGRITAKDMLYCLLTNPKFSNRCPRVIHGYVKIPKVGQYSCNFHISIIRVPCLLSMYICGIRDIYTGEVKVILVPDLDTSFAY